MSFASGGRDTMRIFSCKACEQTLFFENTVCLNCQAEVAYLPDIADFVVVPKGLAVDAAFELELPGKGRQKLRRCKNFAAGACNWLFPIGEQQGSEPEVFCASCRLTSIIPDLSNEQHRAAWLEIEQNKRRLLYTLQALALPVVGKGQDPEAGLTFRFMSDTEREKVMTGHSAGVITINVAEANGAFRENLREKLGEGYRTVLGHLRHEIGHYYWDRLVLDRPALAGFRKLFGDEQQSYQDAIQRHYDQGPPANWAESFISAYATMHPWEDWAETWAHYLHMVDTLETAKSHGLVLRVPGAGAKVVTEGLDARDFDEMTSSWRSVTLALNSLNRSMGLKDAYPFVPTETVQKKLRFIHDLIRQPRPVPSKGAPKSSRATPRSSSAPGETVR
jgi:hypothetical protein